MAAFDAFAIENTGAETNLVHTTEATRALSGATALQQGDWAGNWTSPNLTIPNTSHIIAGYSDQLLYSGVARSGSHCQFRIATTNQGINGATNFGYTRNAGNEFAVRSGVYLASRTASDVLQIREGTIINGTSRIGDYDRTAGFPRGLWAVELPSADFIYTSLTSLHTAAGSYGDTPRPIDLGTPSAFTDGSAKAITVLTTDASSGTTITESSGVFTVAANSKVLCVATFQSSTAATDRNCFMVRANVGGSPYLYVGGYTRGSSPGHHDDTHTLVFPVVTGGASVAVEFFFMEQNNETGFELDLQDCFIGFYDLTSSDFCILEKTDADETNFVTAHRQISWPVADEVVVDSGSFEHPTGSLTRIKNNAGETITVLAGFTIFFDRGLTDSQRKQMGAQLLKSGTAVDYMIAARYARGNTGGDDNQCCAISYCAPVELTSAQYLELDVWDLFNNIEGDMMINCTDGASIQFWAIRLAAPAGGAVGQDALMGLPRRLGRVRRRM